MTLWVTTLHHDDGYGKITYQPICGSNTEEAAHAAGRRAAAYYNRTDVFLGLAGVIDCNFLARENYGYSVKEHKGEWI